MNRNLSLIFIGMIICVLMIVFNVDGIVSANETHNLKLSNMQVKITSKGHTATFRLYDTTAAKEFYNQLPLSLDLTNFRESQWMFYPPRKLNVTAREAYHNGKKGELSYYEPWGDAFMLYKDFYAGDEMHRLGVNLTGIEEIAKMSSNAKIEKNESKATGNTSVMQISVTANGLTTIFELNNSHAARELYEQLPLTISVENYGNNEKIFYPPKKLKTRDTPQTSHSAGGLAYYAPWGDVVMFYDRFGSASGLYTLGKAISGSENIIRMSGTIRIEKR